MSQGLFTAVSGVRTNQTKLSVISNNIANLNTVGFKGAEANFKTVFYQTISNGSAPTSNFGGTNAQQLGYGAAIGEIRSNFSQGGTVFTGRSSDLIINGEGFFTISTTNGNDYRLTRAGNFTLDAKGNLVTASGNNVLGTRTINGNDETQIANINVPQEAVVYRETDSNGDLVSVHFGDATSSAPTAGSGNTMSAGTTVGLTNFSVGPDGTVAGIYSNGDRLTVRTDPSNTNKRELSLLTGDGKSYTISGTNSEGTLSILNSTEIGGPFVKPEQLQVRLAKVTNPLGLTQVGDNNYELGPNTGTVSLGIAANTGRGQLGSGAVESSNVDITAEFTGMIIAQRGLEASAKVISASSDVLRTIINIL